MTDWAAIILWLLASFAIAYALLYALGKFCHDRELLWALRLWRDEP